MTVAPPVPPPVPENGINGSMPAHVNMSYPRFHPIAMNPSQPMPQDPMMHLHPHPHPHPHPHFRPYHPPLQDPGLPASPLDHIEARLKQLEQEEAARMASRSQILAMRKREDEDFRRVTEHAELEEEDLRRQRKRLKRESMGLGFNATIDSPPLRPTPPRRLSETNAATTLAFFKQQSPQDARPPAPPAPAPAPAPPAQLPPHPIPQDPPFGSIRKKQKYTIKNVEAWGERHGRPAAHDPSGRALWKRPSDGSLVYLTCPVPGCGKADFVTLHGFMCHLTKKHKDRSLGSQSRALEVCGVVFDPNAPLPPVSNKRASTEESRLESTHTDPEAYPQEMDYSTGSDDEDGDSYAVKVESAEESTQGPGPLPEESSGPQTHTSTKQTISSIIDNPEDQTRETLSSVPHSNEPTNQLPGYKEKPTGGSPQSEKENSEPKRAEQMHESNRI